MKSLGYIVVLKSFFISNAFINSNYTHKNYYNLYSNVFIPGRKDLSTYTRGRTCSISPSNSEDLTGSKDHKELELKSLREKLSEISEPDFKLEEKYIKASGPGGQKINKSAICVQLIYSNQSGSLKIIIKCKKHRSLLLNRIEATKILISKLEQIKEKELMAMKKENFKESMRNRKLSEKSKYLRMIIKKVRSFKKKMRSKYISDSEY